MRVLITGPTGAVGPHVIAALETHHELVLFARRAIETPHPVVRGDLLSADKCERAVEDVDAVVHLAANSEPAPEAFEVNMLGTYHLLEAARKHGVDRFIFASTNCVYGHCFPITERAFPLEALPIDETHTCVPEDNYGLSKVLDERMLALYFRTWGIRSAALRLNWVWGPEEIAWRQAQGALDAAKHAPYFWAYVDARDAAQAFRLALDAPDLPGCGEYNISAADHFAEEQSGDLLERFYPGVPVGTPMAGRASFISWEAAQTAFQYRPNYSWRDGWQPLE